MNKILEVKNLEVSFNTYVGEVKAVRGVDFELNEGETLAVVGESGCGKTVTAKSIMNLLSKNIVEYKPKSKILYRGKNVLQMSKKELQDFRGNEISMIFQNPMSSLNPTMTCGNQVMESLIQHQKLSKSEAKDEALKMLELVKIPEAAIRFNDYPHQMSGGMRQRIMIAIALACNPSILIADEPTTALDVTIQAQIMDLMTDIKKELGTAIVLVTHDFGIVANFADKVQVMYAGRVVERGRVEDIFKSPQHPYTIALLKSMPKLNDKGRKELFSLKGTPPDLILPLDHCSFADRCEYCMKICKERQPDQVKLSDTHAYSCWLSHKNASLIRKKIDRRLK